MEQGCICEEPTVLRARIVRPCFCLRSGGNLSMYLNVYL